MLKLVNVSKYYNSEGNVALGLRNVSIEFQTNELIALVGESGSGKTTLLNVLSGVDTYEEGEMYFNGNETSYFSVEDWEAYRKNNIGFVFQNYNVIDSYSVLQNVETVLLLQGIDKREARKRSLEIIDQVGLSHRKRSRAAKLSGGEKQRTVIARAIASNAPILVCDEPTGNLDSESGKQIMKLIHQVSSGRLVIVVTHDFKIVEPYATRRVRLFDGEVVEDTPLKPVNQVEPQAISEFQEQKINVKTNWMFALRNLIATPKKTVFSLLVYICISFFVAALYESVFGTGLFVSIYRYNQYYNYQDPARVLVNKKDKTAFTEQELLELESLDNIQTIYRNDQYLDKIFNTEIIGKNVTYSIRSIYHHIDGLKESQLIAGRLPKPNTNEVAITNRYHYDEEDLLNNSYRVFDFNYAGSHEFTVVGIIEMDNSMNMSYYDVMYGGDSLESVCKAVSLINYYQTHLHSTDLTNDIDIYLDINNQLEDGETVLYLDTNYYTKLDNESTIELVLSHYYGKDSVQISPVIYEHKGNSFIQMNESTVVSMTEQNVYQLSLIVEDAYLKDSVISQIKDLGYRTMSTNNSTLQMDAVGSLVNMIMNGIFSFLGFIILYFISYLILSFVVQSKKTDYSVLRVLGADKKALNQIVIFENGVQAGIAYIITLIVILILGNVYPNLMVFKVIQYGEWMKMIMLLFIIVVLSFLISVRFNRKLFKTTINRSLKKD